MTGKELSQLYYLSREIEANRRWIFDLDSKLCDESAIIPGMPNCAKIYKEPRIAAEIADCKAIVQAKAEQCIHEYNRLCRYIAGVNDSLMRQILQYRYISGFNWTQVAMHIGGGNTPDSVRAAHSRFLNKNLQSDGFV